MAATLPPEPVAVVWRMPADTVPELERVFGKMTYTRTEATITIPLSEYKRLKVRDTLAVQADEILTSFQQQLEACEDNRLSLYKLAHAGNLQLLGDINQQRAIVFNPPPVLQPCPLVIVPRPRNWTRYLILGIGLAVGGYVGYNHR